MADILTLANSQNVKGTSGQSTRQPITEAIDVSGYDQLDFEFALWSQNSGGAGIKLTILTSMQNKSDDASWVSCGQSITVGGSSVPDWYTLSVPLLNYAPLLRYIRYQIDFQSGTTDVVVSINGMARRRSA